MVIKMARYKTAISFGLVHIPVSLKPIIKNNDASFNFLHKKCHERILYKKYCPVCKEDVQTKDLIKGYEFKKDDYVIFEEEDFEKLKSEDDKNLDIISFVDIKEIDPIYFEKSYSLVTEESNKAFDLFKYALNKSKKVAIAKTILGNKSYYAILRFGKNNIIMTTLYFEEEIKLEKEKMKQEFTDKELNLALKLIDSMTGKFKPETYKDDYQDKIEEAINLKIEGKEIKQKKSNKTKTINNLMDALEKSLKESKKQK